MDSTIVVTFCEHGENTIEGVHLGEMAKEGEGFSLFDLQKACIWCKNNDVKYELWDLSPGESLGAKSSYLLIMRRYAHKFEDPNSLYQELKNMEWDKKSLNRYGKVVNKHVRHNLVFADTTIEPDYEAGHGKVVDFKTLTHLTNIRNSLEDILGYKCEKMIGEGNHYFDTKKTGISWHGDGWRRRVIGLRAGLTGTLQFRWYYQWKPVSDIMEFELEDGDVYVMSENTVGTDWKKSSIYTLRHSAGKDKKGNNHV